MGKLILALLLVSGNAFANVRECTSVLNTMTDLTRTYTDIYKTCAELEKKGETNTRYYEGNRRIARDAEGIYSRAAAYCYQVCDDTFFCEGELSGACMR